MTRKQNQDIRTIGDIDIYRQQHPVNGQIVSRYKTMINLYGEQQANIMMRELEVKSWRLPEKHTARV